MRSNTGWMGRPKAAQGGTGREIMRWGRGRLLYTSYTSLQGEPEVSVVNAFLYWFVVYNKQMGRNGPVGSPYAPGEVPRGPQVRSRWPWAAYSPLSRRIWTSYEFLQF